MFQRLILALSVAAFLDSVGFLLVSLIILNVCRLNNFPENLKIIKLMLLREFQPIICLTHWFSLVNWRLSL